MSRPTQAVVDASKKLWLRWLDCDNLNKREIYILNCKVGFGKKKMLTKEIADDLRISRQWLWQLEQRIIKKLADTRK